MIETDECVVPQQEWKTKGAMRTWVLCLLLGLVCLIAISIATLVLQLPPELLASSGPEKDSGQDRPPLKPEKRNGDLTILGPGNDVAAVADDASSDTDGDAGAPQSLLAPPNPLPDAYLVPSASSAPDTSNRGGGNNDLETNIGVLSVTDIGIAVDVETTTSALATPPPRLPEHTEDGRPLVHTTTGRVAGYKTEVLGRKLDVFLGIPFATPPLGDLRFKRPLPVRPWETILDATNMGPPCYHISFTSSWSWTASKKPESEDCLHLNVWTPNTAGHNATKGSTRLKPMIVFIYGGGFNIGSTDWDFYDGGIMAAYGDVVVASMNYRLGALGFLNADSEDIPGNMGLYDQQLAIQWLHENARSFGADPGHLVLMGESAGAVSAGLHLISPMSRSMVKRVILQSGSPLWDTPDNTADGIKKATEFAEIFKCANSTHNFQDKAEADDVVRCLREIDAGTLFSTAEKALGKRVLTYHPRYGDDFMPINAHEALRKGLFKDSDVLLGVNKDEGSIFVANTLPYIFLNGLAPNITKDEAAFYLIFFFQYIIRTGTRDIRDHYFKNIKDRDYPSVRNAFIEAIGDYLQICPTIYYGEVYSEFNNSVYFYHFTHRPSNSYWPEWLGTAHFDEVEFVFGVPLRFPEQFTEEEVTFSRQIMDIWLTFAKTGKPPEMNGTQWPRYSELNPVHMELSPRRFRLGKGLHADHCRFWKKFILK
ncbi:acetylcholinesterase-1-like isoform X1 [Amblyomma americanum]